VCLRDARARFERDSQLGRSDVREKKKRERARGFISSAH
jgi:hypothetical protein